MKKQSLKNLLKNKDYLFMLFGMFISRTGSFMQTIAVNWHIYQLTKSTLSLGIIGLARFLPILFFSFIAGAVADAFDRKKIIFWVQVFYIFGTLCLYFLTINHNINPLMIYMLVAFDTACYTFDSPTRQTITPSIVSKQDFPMAINVSNIIYNLSAFIGPALGGFVIAYMGVSTVYLINAISFVAVIIALLLMNPLPKMPIKVSFNLQSIHDGFKYVFKSPLIYGSMFIDFFATFFGSAMTMLPVMTTAILKVGPREMGLLYAAPSIGAVLAGILYPIFDRNKHKGRMLISAVIFYGLMTLLFGLSKNFILSFILFLLSGSGDMISAMIRNIIRQLTTPDHIRGRMTAINMFFYTAGPQLGEVEAGFVASLIGTPFSIALGGFLTIISAVLVAKTVPKLAAYQDGVE